MLRRWGKLIKDYWPPGKGAAYNQQGARHLRLHRVRPPAQHEDSALQRGRGTAHAGQGHGRHRHSTGAYLPPYRVRIALRRCTSAFLLPPGEYLPFCPPQVSIFILPPQVSILILPPPPGRYFRSPPPGEIVISPPGEHRHSPPPQVSIIIPLPSK